MAALSVSSWLKVSWSYSRRRNAQAEVGRFVERDDTSATSTLVPTFGSRRFTVDQSSGILTLSRKDLFWASLRVRLLGRPDTSYFDGGGAVTADVTLGWRPTKAVTLSATVLDLNEGGTFFDASSGGFVHSERDARLSAVVRHGF